MKNKIYTAAVIGTGRIGFSLGFDCKREQPASHTMALLANKRVRIVCGIDSNEENLLSWQKYVCKKQPGLPKPAAFSSIDKFLLGLEQKHFLIPDIVVISVNEESHMDVAIRLIEAKPSLVILEKPVALTVEQGMKIVDAAKSFGVPVLVNHERRFAADYAIARNYIEKIGDLQSVSARLDSGLRVYAKENESDGSYSLLHDGTHLVDVLLFLLEAKSFGKEDLLSNMRLLNFHLDEKDPGVVRNLTVGYDCPYCSDVQLRISGRSRFFGFEVTVIGTEGAFTVGNGIFCFEKRCQSKLYSGFYSLKKDFSVKRPKKTLYFSNMVQNAIDFLDGKAELKSTLENGMSSLALLEDIKLLLAKEIV